MNSAGVPRTSAVGRGGTARSRVRRARGEARDRVSATRTSPVGASSAIAGVVDHLAYCISSTTPLSSLILALGKKKNTRHIGHQTQTHMSRAAKAALTALWDSPGASKLDPADIAALKAAATTLVRAL
jgi:hypothetical protein